MNIETNDKVENTKSGNSGRVREIVNGTIYVIADKRSRAETGQHEFAMHRSEVALIEKDASNLWTPATRTPTKIARVGRNVLVDRLDKIFGVGHRKQNTNEYNGFVWTDHRLEGSPEIAYLYFYKDSPVSIYINRPDLPLLSAELNCVDSLRSRLHMWCNSAGEQISTHLSHVEELRALCRSPF